MARSHRGKSVSTSWRDPEMCFTSLNWLMAPQHRWRQQRQWELYGRVVWKQPPQKSQSPLAVNEGEMLPCWGSLGWPLNTGTFLSNSVWPEPNMLAEGHQIRSATYTWEGGESEAKWLTSVKGVEENPTGCMVWCSGVVLGFWVISTHCSHKWISHRSYFSGRWTR